MSEKTIKWNRSAKRKLTPWRGSKNNPKKLAPTAPESTSWYRETYDHSDLRDADQSSWEPHAVQVVTRYARAGLGAPLNASYEAMYALRVHSDIVDPKKFGANLCAVQGIAFALEVVAQMVPMRRHMRKARLAYNRVDIDRMVPMSMAIKRELAAADQASYDTARARAEELWEEHEGELEVKVALAYAFPDHPEWGVEVAQAWPVFYKNDLDELEDYIEMMGLLCGSGASKESLLALADRLCGPKADAKAEKRRRYHYYMRPRSAGWNAAFELVDRLGEDAVGVLARMYDVAWVVHPTPIAEAMALIASTESAQALSTHYIKWLDHHSRPKKWDVDTTFFHEHPELSLEPLETTLAQTKRGKTKFKVVLKDIKAQLTGATKEKTKSEKYVTRDLLPPGLASPIWRDKSRKRERKKYDPSAFADLAQLPGGRTPGSSGDHPSDPEQVAHMAHGLGHVTTRTKCLRWVRAFPEAAAIGAIPRLLKATDAKERNGFIEVLRVAHIEDAEAVEAVIADYGEEVAAALPTLDPYQFCPTRMPKLPHYWTPELWTPIRLESDPSKFLPHEIHEDIGFMLKFSPSGVPFIGLLELREVADETSLADFAWDFFESWLGADAPNKDFWVIQAIALFGGAKMADALPHYINRWCDGGVHRRRAEKVIEALDNGENPYVIEMFWRLIQTIRCQGLKHTLEHVQQITGLEHGIDTIADIAAPTFGLGPNRQLELEPGSDLEVWLDADLEPHLRTSNQAKVRLSPTARLRWKRLKTQCARENLFQAMRLERAMKLQRRWDFTTWRETVLAQPLIGILAQRLVWGTYDSKNELVATWRVDESNEIVDVEDEPAAPASGARVGIVHPVELSEHDRREWTLVLGDYEIIQPFAQVTRVLDDVSDAALDELASKLSGSRFRIETLYQLVETSGWTLSFYTYSGCQLTRTYTYPAGNAHTGQQMLLTLSLWQDFALPERPHLMMRSKAYLNRVKLNPYGEADRLKHLDDISRAELYSDLSRLCGHVVEG